MEVIKNKLTTLLYGLDGSDGIDKSFYEDPTNLNLDIDNTNYMLFDSFSDFMDNISYKLNYLYDEETSEEEEEEESDIDNILWFIDSYVLIKDELWYNWIKELRETNNILYEDNIRLKEQIKLKGDHIELQYYKEGNKRSKTPYPRKNCRKCRGSINGICVQHGGLL